MLKVSSVTSSEIAGKSIAVLLPCFNESVTIAQVIDDFREALPTARIFVYDNNSTDMTAEIAEDRDAIVRHELRQGKGNVVRRMFSDIDADVYVLVDGDDTYQADIAPHLVQVLISDDLDMINAARVTALPGAYRPGHRFGNFLLSTIVQIIFGRNFEDMLSGYKVLSRRFVKSFPAMSSGFEIETEIAVHALELRIPCAEIKTDYSDRPPGSASKLRTFRDGFRILLLILRLVRDERPFPFFGSIGVFLCLAALVAGIPLIGTYIQTGLVPRVPTAILSVGLVMLGVLFIFTGLILDLTTRTRREMKRLIYLSTSKNVSNV